MRWAAPTVIADKAHDAQAQLIENFVARLKQYRAVAPRYDKTARNRLGTVLLTASIVWLDHLSCHQMAFN
jgi:transposase